ncbi:hypothetical protein G6F66_000652 [Rhizopus arrhizus]|nr:hypothetical protein G6F66_000652 [Rhizopus arrhizus]
MSDQNITLNICLFEEGQRQAIKIHVCEGMNLTSGLPPFAFILKIGSAHATDLILGLIADPQKDTVRRKPSRIRWLLKSSCPALVHHGLARGPKGSCEGLGEARVKQVAKKRVDIEQTVKLTWVSYLDLESHASN